MGLFQASKIQLGIFDVQISRYHRYFFLFLLKMGRLIRGQIMATSRPAPKRKVFIRNNIGRYK